jgi:hypothetical protein
MCVVGGGYMNPAVSDPFADSGAIAGAAVRKGRHGSFRVVLRAHGWPPSTFQSQAGHVTPLVGA